MFQYKYQIQNYQGEMVPFHPYHEIANAVASALHCRTSADKFCAQALPLAQDFSPHGCVVRDSLQGRL